MIQPPREDGGTLHPIYHLAACGGLMYGTLFAEQWFAATDSAKMLGLLVPRVEAGSIWFSGVNSLYRAWSKYTPP
jgi:hypothetical protein